MIYPPQLSMELRTASSSRMVPGVNISTGPKQFTSFNSSISSTGSRYPRAFLIVGSTTRDLLMPILPSFSFYSKICQNYLVFNDFLIWAYLTPFIIFVNRLFFFSNPIISYISLFFFPDHTSSFIFLFVS